LNFFFDRFSPSIAFARLVEKANTATAVAFLKELVEVTPLLLRSKSWTWASSAPSAHHSSRTALRAFDIAASKK
jgi:hypothetical protein